MNIQFTSNFLLGLYLFLRQSQLSIDRCPPDSWNKLVNYFEVRTPIRRVIKVLENTALVSIDNISVDEIVNSLNKRNVLSIWRSKNCLSEKELTYIYSCLLVLEDMFSCFPDRETLVNLRLRLADAEMIVYNRLKRKTVVGRENIEHFNQSDMLSCKSIDELVGDVWL